MIGTLLTGAVLGALAGEVIGRFGKSGGKRGPGRRSVGGALWGAGFGALIALAWWGGGSATDFGDGGRYVGHVASAAEFRREVLDAEKPVFVDVYTDTCVSCRKLAPVFGGLAEENHDRAAFFSLNAQKVPEVFREYELVGVPTVLLFHRGVLRGKLVGVQGIDAYRSALARLLAESSSASGPAESAPATP